MNSAWLPVCCDRYSAEPIRGLSQIFTTAPPGGVAQDGKPPHPLCYMKPENTQPKDGPDGRLRTQEKWWLPGRVLLDAELGTWSAFCSGWVDFIALEEF